jgi:hypothetical protein
VQNDERYDYAARKEVSASSWSKWGNVSAGVVSPNSQIVNSQDEAYCDVYEYYDINTGMMSIFADGGDKFLVKPTKIPYVFGHPFYMLRDYDIPNVFYPMGELEAIEPLQAELNETRTQMMNHRKRYSRKWLFNESAFDDFGRQALVSDDDNVIVPVKGNENINNVIVPMPALINPPEFYNQSSLITNDIDRVSGISEYQRGAIPETTRTAREASIIAEAANARVSEKLISIENSIASCASNLIKLAQQFMTETQTVRIVGSTGAPIWLEFDKNYINGEFDFTVEAGSTAPHNEAFRRDMAMQMVSALGPFAQAGIVDMPKLAEHVLSIGFGIKNPSDFIIKQPAGPEGMPAPEGAPAPGSPQEAAMQSLAEMPGGGAPSEGQPAPEELMAIVEALQAGEITPDQVPPEILAMLEGGAPMEQAPEGEAPMPSEEELIMIMEGLQSGEITEDMVPPEILALLNELIAGQGAEAPMQQAPEGEIPEEILAIIEALQSGQITPEQVPPEIMDQVAQYLQ